MSQHGVVMEDGLQVSRVGDGVDTLVQRRRDSIQQGGGLRSRRTRDSQSCGCSRSFQSPPCFPARFGYLLDIRHRQELLQPGQEVQHQHLQRAVVLRPEIRGKNVLERTTVESTVLFP